MFFQIDTYTRVYIAAISVYVFVALIILLIGTEIMCWYGRKKDWGGSFKPAFVVNLLWFVIDFSLGIYFLFVVAESHSVVSIASLNPLGICYFLYAGGSLLVDVIIIFIIRIIINFILGTILVMKLYKKKVVESLISVIVVSIIIFLIGFVIGLIFGFILMYTFPLYMDYIYPPPYYA